MQKFPSVLAPSSTVMATKKLVFPSFFFHAWTITRSTCLRLLSRVILQAHWDAKKKKKCLNGSKNRRRSRHDRKIPWAIDLACAFSKKSSESKFGLGSISQEIIIVYDHLQQTRYLRICRSMSVDF